MLKKKAIFEIEKLNKFRLNNINNKDIVAYALNRKIAIYNSYYYGSKDTLNLIKDIGKEIFTLEDKITNKEIIAYTKNELANIEDYKGDKSKAIKMYEEALDYAKQNNLLNPEIDISYNLALI